VFSLKGHVSSSGGKQNRRVIKGGKGKKLSGSKFKPAKLVKVSEKPNV
jgi:hypothetical protein